MNKKNSPNPTKIGPDYFNVSTFSSETRDQLLKSQKSQINKSSLPHESLTTIVKKEKNYLESVLDEFRFSYDVIAERCAHMLPYDEKFYETIYNFPESIKKVKKPKFYAEKHFCHTDVKNIDLLTLPVVDKSQKTFKTFSEKKIGEPIDLVMAENVSKVPRKHWDEYLLSLMSQNTAQYLAYDLTKDENQAVRLKKLVDNWYGAPPSFRELIPDDSDDIDQDQSKKDLKSIFPYKHFMDIVKSVDKPIDNSKKNYQIDPTPRTKIKNLLDKEKNLFTENDQTDPYGDDTKASFYRLPVLVRKTKKMNKEVNLENINKTTKSLMEFKLPETPPKPVNHRIGEKILKPNNQFQQEIYFNENGHQRKLLNQPDNIINFDDKIYLKNLQPIWPSQISTNQHSVDESVPFQPIANGITKGHNRWTQLPCEQQEHLLNAEILSEADNPERQNSRKRARDHSSLNLLVDQWRKKWQLTQKYADSTVYELLRDMTDVHPTIRLQAIVTAAKAASHIHDKKYGHTTTTTTKDTIESDSLPSVLVKAIEILLDDPHFQVRKASAIALHSLEKSTEKSMSILRELLLSKSTVDRWAAVQCLALSNDYDSDVINELIDQLMNSEDIIIHEKASFLLAKISYHTKLTHGMLGEKLNTLSWRQRIIICKTIPLLHGSLNKDLLRKVIYIMWNDPHKQVRIAASQVLGKTGNGKAVHEELIAKLQNKSELVRADALEKIGILKVMTTRIMPGFMKCFQDEFVLVRKEVCRACYRLNIQDTLCVNNLLELARFDPLWKVKLYAIKALSKIEICTPEIRSCFLWALQFESHIQLRMVSLQAISTFKTLDNEIIDIIKSRFLVEKDKTIISVLKKILHRVNINSDIDFNTIAEIKNEVRKFLSNKNHIIDLILYNEAVEDYNYLKDLMIVPTDPSKISDLNDVENDEFEEKSESESDEEDDNIDTGKKEIEAIERINSDVTVKSDFSSPLENLAEKEIFNNFTTDEGLLIKENTNVKKLNDEENIKESSEEIIEIKKEMSNINENRERKENNFEEMLEHINNPSEFVSDDNLINGESVTKLDEMKYSDLSIPTTEYIETNNGNAALIINENDENLFVINENDKNISSNTLQSDTNDKEVPNFNSDITDSKEDEFNTENKKNNQDSNSENIPEISLIKTETIKWDFSLPRDSSHIKIYDHNNDKSFMNYDLNLFRNLSNTDLIETTVNPNILEQIYQAIQEEGLDCGD